MTGDMVGVEALVRWPQPDGSLLLPNDFVPLAEETGLMVQLGHAVLDQACRQAASWRALPGVDEAFTVAVNVSSRQLQDLGFAAGVAAILTRSGLPPEGLIMEVTEGALLDEGETTTTSIAGVKELGVQIALDDFGTGYSSLSHLRRFPIDILKIDRSFVAGVDDGEQGERALVRSIIRLAHSLKLETVAEGVERPSQLTQLRALGARLGQGFLFARPMTAAGITELLHDRRRMVS
jgi:EAL domain-containing protein (putative c-di-GMP-specific phosphodiesterase class I)